MSEAAAALQLERVRPQPLVWRRLKRHRLAIGSIVALTIVALACLLAPVVAPYAFDQIDLASIRQPPAAGHWFGTDDLGRDLFTRILYGGRVSLSIGLIAALVATFVGALVGALAGYFGGRTDNVLMRLTDTAYSIPSLPLLIVLGSYARSAAVAIALIIGLLSWMTTARVVRGTILSIREAPWVEAARAIGAGHVRIMFRHILPNVAGPIIVGATLAVGNAIILESSLSFLGLGVQPPTPTWGNMLMDAQATMATRPWLTIFPGIAILITVLAINFIGDGLQDALDPKASP